MPLNGGRSVGEGSRKPLTFWVSLTFVGRIMRRILHGVPQDDRQADGGEAEGYSAETATAFAPVDREHGEVVTVSGSRLFPISRGTPQRATNESVPARSAAPVVAATSTAESTHPLELEQVSGDTREPATASHHPASVS